MRIETAEAAPRRATLEVGLSLEAPTLEGVPAAMSAFAREPDGVPVEQDHHLPIVETVRWGDTPPVAGGPELP